MSDYHSDHGKIVDSQWITGTNSASKGTAMLNTWTRTDHPVNALDRSCMHCESFRKVATTVWAVRTPATLYMRSFTSLIQLCDIHSATIENEGRTDE